MAATKGLKFLRVAERDGWTCQLCLRPVTLIADETGADPDRASLDHIIPRSNGGSNADWNLRLTHAGCNEARGCRLVVYPGQLSLLDEEEAMRAGDRFPIEFARHASRIPDRTLCRKALIRMDGER